MLHSITSWILHELTSIVSVPFESPALMSGTLYLVTLLMPIVYGIVFDRKVFKLLLKTQFQLIKRCFYYVKFLPFVFMGFTSLLLFLFLFKHYTFSREELSSILCSTAYTCLPMILLLIRYIYKTVTTKLVRNIIFTLLGFTIWSFIWLLHLFGTFLVDLSYNMNWDILRIAIFILNGLVLIYLESRNAKAEREIEDFGTVDLFWAHIGEVLQGLLALDQGRLNLLYIALRLRGFKTKPALVLSFMKTSVLLPFMAIFSYQLPPFRPLEIIICFAVLCITTHLILNLKDKRLKQVVILSGISKILVGTWIMKAGYILHCTKPIQREWILAPESESKKR